jgi:outer membrane protein OmpA-like peptidoglycan-associated protein
MRIVTAILVNTVLIVAAGLIGWAQDQESGSQTRWKLEKRATFAIEYPENESTSATMVGTLLDKQVTGHLDAIFDGKQTRVNARFNNLPHPQAISVNYTSYVTWVIKPDGEADNLGQLAISKDRSDRTELTIPHQVFGLIVTAEPHPLVKHPGPQVVAENFLNKDSYGRATQRVIEYRGDPGIFYGAGGGLPAALGADYETPLSVLGARRAVDIARRAGARENANAELQQAESMLDMLEQLWPKYLTGNGNDSNDRKAAEIRDDSLEVMRLAEAARTIAVGDVEAAPAKPGEQKQKKIELIAARRGFVLIETERPQLDSKQRDSAWQRLQSSISSMLEVRREGRSLVVSLHDALFDLNQASLTLEAKQNLSRLTGMLLNYPGRPRIEIEGYTDSNGSDAYNLKLSEGRAASVRNQMLQAGLPAHLIVAVRGLGKARPIETNDTPLGRYINRRVEIIIVDTEMQPSQ